VVKKSIYDEMETGLIKRTPEWTVCTYFSDRQFNAFFSYGLDFDEVYRYSVMFLKEGYGERLKEEGMS